MKRDAEAEAADPRLSASGRIGHSQQVNAPTITTTTTDVSGSTSYPFIGGETERGIQNDGEFNLEDEENLKSKGTVPVINGSADSKDSHQDQTDQNDQRDDNYNITKGDELKEADHLETENKRVPFWRKLIAYRPWKSKRSSSDLERKGQEEHGIYYGGSEADACGYLGYQGSSWEPNPGSPMGQKRWSFAGEGSSLGWPQKSVSRIGARLQASVGVRIGGRDPAKKDLASGVDTYLVQVVSKLVERKSVVGIPVIKEFSDVFEDDHPGLPAVQDVEFTIDL
ncbi:uncharacterized protein LOC121242155 [Juglans microcarpa x Juglans regia]|uniref:uncharacterized protein LOC121242155 n=1 Tax=Juglans microcarpa x Juglans regia TaxID=2249226 RepID=UPI001B7E8C0F|nr:uncharacterized protein LOC121242155 [Juglans microcarpa x Juglans regia]